MYPFPLWTSLIFEYVCIHLCNLLHHEVLFHWWLRIHLLIYSELQLELIPGMLTTDGERHPTAHSPVRSSFS